MRVSGEEVFRVSQLGPSGDSFNVSPAITASLMGSNVTTAPQRPSETTMHSYSANPLDVHRVTEAMDSVPDVREDVVASLRARIEAGTYSVTGEQIAEMLVRRFYADRIR